MQATFHLDAAELNANLIEAIKKAFLGKKNKYYGYRNNFCF